MEHAMSWPNESMPATQPVMQAFEAPQTSNPSLEEAERNASRFGHEHATLGPSFGRFMTYGPYGPPDGAIFRHRFSNRFNSFVGQEPSSVGTGRATMHQRMPLAPLEDVSRTGAVAFESHPLPATPANETQGSFSTQPQQPSMLYRPVGMPPYSTRDSHQLHKTTPPSRKALEAYWNTHYFKQTGITPHPSCHNERCYTRARELASIRRGSDPRWGYEDHICEFAPGEEPRFARRPAYRSLASTIIKGRVVRVRCSGRRIKVRYTEETERAAMKQAREARKELKQESERLASLIDESMQRAEEKNGKEKQDGEEGLGNAVESLNDYVMVGVDEAREM